MTRRWHFFRAGGVDQVSLRDGADLAALDELDQKLWVVLAMPTRDVDVDPATLDLLDDDRDGSVRVHDILKAVRWVRETWKRPDDVLAAQPKVLLASIADPKVLAASRRVLADLGKGAEDAITVEDALAVTKAFASTRLNGDGVVTPDSTDDPELQRLIQDVLATHGSLADRSGKPGIDAERADKFFADVDKLAEWTKKGATEPALSPLPEGTAAAADALVAIAPKLDDYFARCQLAAFDGRTTATLSGSEEDLKALGVRPLTTGADEVARLPLARIDASGRLPLAGGHNPAWAGRLKDYVERAVRPLLGAREALTVEDAAKVAARLAPVLEWRSQRPVTPVGNLEAAWLARLAEASPRAALAALIAADKALETEYGEIASVERMVRFQRDLGRILRNFVNMSDFYQRQDGAFQAGTLYMDGRACHLCVPVADPAKHAALAGSSEAFLAYCDLRRGSERKQIAAAFTNGAADDIVVGRNGIFYDRSGRDWDATVARIISNPISVREGFWAPYRKLVRLVEEQVAKRAAAGATAADTRIQEGAVTVATIDQAPAAPAPVARPEAKKVDVGTVAAIGVAIGGIGAMVVGLLSSFFGLGIWMPIGLIGLILAISGPSMLLAWLKLRRRNIGPLLDANGWAINGRTRINVAFGAALTEVAALPLGSARSLDDPYADKSRPWKTYFAVVLLLVLGGMWGFGKLDPYLPRTMRSVAVLRLTAAADESPRPAPEKAPRRTAKSANSADPI